MLSAPQGNQAERITRNQRASILMADTFDGTLNLACPGALGDIAGPAAAMAISCVVSVRPARRLLVCTSVHSCWKSLYS